MLVLNRHVILELKRLNILVLLIECQISKSNSIDQGFSLCALESKEPEFGILYLSRTSLKHEKPNVNETELNEKQKKVAGVCEANQVAKCIWPCAELSKRIAELMGDLIIVFLFYDYYFYQNRCLYIDL